VAEKFDLEPRAEAEDFAFAGLNQVEQEGFEKPLTN
jgi:hypothetical protein